jgi:hypothetical protein
MNIKKRGFGTNKELAKEAGRLGGLKSKRGANKSKVNKVSASYKRRKAMLDRAYHIRELLNTGLSQSDIAIKLGLSRQRINQILNHHKQSARSALNYAVNAGHITKPTICEQCRLVGANLHGHHKDYGLPYEVKWLCSYCHGIEHTTTK